MGIVTSESDIKTHFISCEERLPVYTIFSRFDPDWVRKEARVIVEQYQPTDYGNNSGKFFKNYETYWFYKDSNNGLIKAFVSEIEKRAPQFQEIYGREPSVNFIFLSRVRDASKPASIFHKDGYFWNGIFHLTIEGECDMSYVSNTKIEQAHDIQPSEQQILKFETGSFWYFNSTPFFHTINCRPGERLELCAPCDMHPEYVQRCLESFEPKADGYVDGTKEKWRKYKKFARDYVMQAISSGRASNFQVADFTGEDE